MSYFFTLLLLTHFGLVIAAYLIWTREHNIKPACVIGKDCQKVLQSKYNKLFFINNDLAGAFFYITMIGLIILLRYDIGPVDLMLSALKLLAAIGAITSGAFLVIQWKVLKAWCFWCTVSNINTWIIAYIIFGTI